jgi:hypothetical protein
MGPAQTKGPQDTGAWNGHDKGNKEFTEEPFLYRKKSTLGRFEKTWLWELFV